MPEAAKPCLRHAFRPLHPRLQGPIDPLFRLVFEEITLRFDQVSRLQHHRFRLVENRQVEQAGLGRRLLVLDAFELALDRVGNRFEQFVAQFENQVDVGEIVVAQHDVDAREDRLHLVVDLHQILDLLLDINRRFNLTIVLITHEMHVVRKICDRVAVMENGKVVEEGDVLSVFTHPQQPITRQFVRQVSQYAEEETFNTELANDLEGTVIRLTFTGHSTHRPIVGELTLRYGLPFNILHGKMTQTAHGVFGQLWVHVVASDEQLNNILADLKQSDIEGEVIKHG